VFHAWLENAMDAGSFANLPLSTSRSGSGAPGTPPTNQFGLTTDTVTAMELVLPNGKVKVVPEKDKDLWWALKVSQPIFGRTGREISQRCHIHRAD
jgi:hypothetical protein